MNSKFLRKCGSLVGFGVALFIAACRPEGAALATKAVNPHPEAGGIFASQHPKDRYYSDRDEKRLQRGDTVTISFPEPMIARAEIDKAVQKPPVRLTPVVAFKFKWVSVSEGEVTVVGDPVPGTAHRMDLALGLRNISGQLVNVPDFGLSWEAAPFTVSLENRYGREDPEREYAKLLSAQPKLRVRFSHPVAADDVARTVVWRDETQKVIPSEVELVNIGNEVSATRFDVTPRQPLTAGHRYDLLVEDTRCTLGGVRLPYPHVFALGQTKPMQIVRVSAYHQPKEGAFIAICFNQLVEATGAPAKQVKITPTVEITRTEVSGSEIRMFGAFKPDVRYSVQIAPGVRSQRGYALGVMESWKATFHHKRAAVIIPRSILTTPATAGLRVDFVQVNTGVLHWQLAQVPRESMLVIHARLNEYRDWDKVQPERNSPSHELRLNLTEPLIPALKLPVLLEGNLEASSGDEEVSRSLTFSPEQIPAGMYLLELVGPTEDGRVAGNRVLVFVNREFLVWKQMPAGLGGRIFDVVTGDPVPEAKLQLLNRAGELKVEVNTDADGDFYFESDKENLDAAVALIERSGRTSAHFVPFGGEVPWFRHWRQQVKDGGTLIRQWLFTDRRIYRPGETIKFQGIVRDVTRLGQLKLPETNRGIPWVVKRSGNDEPVLTGQASLSEIGSWDDEVVLPADMPLGRYSLEAAETTCEVKVDEFRAPAFLVEVEPKDSGKDGHARVRVLSRYFHGAPNAKALVRWRAVWTEHRPYSWSDDHGSYVRTADECSPGIPLRRPYWVMDDEEHERSDAEARNLTYDGTVTLDANGVAELESSALFPPSARLAFAQVRWEVSVVAADGQTVSAEHSQYLSLQRAQPAIDLSAGNKNRELTVNILALNAEAAPVSAVPLQLELYRVEEKSVRELVSSHVVRYRNVPVFTRVLNREIVTPFKEIVPVETPGRYVAVASLGAGVSAPRASADAYVNGNASAEFAQWDDQTIELKPDRVSYRIGDTAHVALLAPFAGRCWVTVESDRVLYSKCVTLAANATGVDVPVTAEMHPNAHVCVYLFQPASVGETAERLGSCELRVEKLDTRLDLVTTLEAEQVEPGVTVRGTVTVSCEGRPTPDAELTVFAVDESILRYGQWALPEPSSVFFPRVEHEVTTWSGIAQFKSGPADEALFQKGFLLGDGGASWRGRFVRSRFRSLAFWQSRLKTDAAGRVNFEFVAPDNLTAYRIVAVGHRGTYAFGSGEKFVQVARKLQAEPALPRFVRNGDFVDARVILRQREFPQMPVHVICTVEGAVIDGPAQAEVALAQGLPLPVVFKVRVGDDSTRFKVKFVVRANDHVDLQDEVELEIPVRAATVLRHESVAGEIPAENWTPMLVQPTAWSQGKGTVDLILSRSPWLPLLEGLPNLLEYPHGCSEQVSGRVLAYALMADLLRALPDGEKRESAYQHRVTEGLFRLSRAQLPEGDIAYWPGTTEPNAFVTIQSAWAVAEAQRSGFKVSPALVTGLKVALLRMVRRQDRVRVGVQLRAFALMVAASLDPAVKPQAEALEIYEQRDQLGDDGRSFLALALHRFGILSAEKKQLLAELEHESVARSFDVTLFNSDRRTAALRLCTRAEILGKTWTESVRDEQQHTLTSLMETSQDFSTQENLWMLLAFRALTRAEPGVVGNEVKPVFADALPSRDGQAQGWYEQSLADFADRFSGKLDRPTGMRSYYLRATYRLPAKEAREDRGFRVERVVRDLTESTRDGSAERPFRLGDEVKVTFRVFAERTQAYVALEESLPAAFETIDPEYYRATQRHQSADEEGVQSMRLSHWEKRDDRTLWYFDAMPAGPQSYSVVVRVTSTGRFHWPGVVVSPMYDHRFSGVSEGTEVEVH